MNLFKPIRMDKQNRIDARTLILAQVEQLLRELLQRQVQGREQLKDKANILLLGAMVHAERGETKKALGECEMADKLIAAIREFLLMSYKPVALDRIRIGKQNRINKLKRKNYTREEIEVLLWSSRIASGVFQPWIDEEVRAYNFSPDKPWEDPDCVLKPLKLSKEQKVRFPNWARPSEIIAMRDKKTPKPLRNITMIKAITPDTIKQSCVSDCSFIAGICVAAEFERRFNRRLVTSLIHPQSPDTGMPIYNEKGVYIVKLWFNGVERRVLVDDFLPVDENGELLCSHTENNDGCLELWVPILEKAYMKLCGGYDFPGSNSGVDLFCLMGWIPERIYFPEDPDDVKDFESTPDRVWERLLDAYEYGDYLATVSTRSDLKEEVATEMGLSTGHAYAVLRIFQSSNGTKLLQLKNPWASKITKLTDVWRIMRTQGWTGRFSAQDKHSWSDPAFCEEVGYDASSSATDDNGIFWMSWDDVLLYLCNIHVSWNPELFDFRTEVHARWDANVGPEDDSYNLSHNPQYTITLSEEAIRSKATLWLLLSRHVTKQEQENENGEVSDCLTLHIHRIKDENQLVYSPDSNRILEGVYTKNQHVLVRYDAESSENQVLSVVLSREKKSNDVGYTLSCYCTKEFKLGRPKHDFALRQTILGL
ncbi:hypothetical protein ACHAXA_010569 [Cyclostephanos tholiformis]|uniref:Calpain catalytic domain-containing protein n=1 Tax=Cyclostephanos tholiformis TaxID=382380 RepID=A0ABD3RJD7_9STRA